MSRSYISKAGLRRPLFRCPRFCYATRCKHILRCLGNIEKILLLSFTRKEWKKTFFVTWHEIVCIASQCTSSQARFCDSSAVVLMMVHFYDASKNLNFSKTKINLLEGGYWFHYVTLEAILILWFHISLSMFLIPCHKCSEKFLFVSETPVFVVGEDGLVIDKYGPEHLAIVDNTIFPEQERGLIFRTSGRIFVSRASPKRAFWTKTIKSHGKC